MVFYFSQLGSEFRMASANLEAKLIYKKNKTKYQIKKINLAATVSNKRFITF
jgi:hypothetical protein